MFKKNLVKNHSKKTFLFIDLLEPFV